MAATSFVEGETNMFFEFVGTLAICIVGLVFVFFGLLGSSMPAVIAGTLVFFVGTYFTMSKFTTEIIAPPVETYSLTLSIDNTTIITLTLTIVILIIAPYAMRAWMKR